jgi:osmotically-inducible protein OsmY
LRRRFRVRAGVCLLLTVCAVACSRRSAPEGRAELQPSEPRAPESRDDRLSDQVRAKLYGDPTLSGGGSIVVLVHGGHVVLEGWVASVNERTLAEADAATVAGVASVDDRLLVRQAAIVPVEAGED